MCYITEEKAVFFFCFLFLGQDPRWSAIKVNGWKVLTIITKRSILDVAAALDQHLLPKQFIRRNIDPNRKNFLCYILSSLHYLSESYLYRSCN